MPKNNKIRFLIHCVHCPLACDQNGTIKEERDGGEND